MIWLAEPVPEASISVTSENPPMRLAMSPEGGPSSVVTTPDDVAVALRRDVHDLQHGRVDLARPPASVVSETTLPKTSALVDHDEPHRVDRAPWCRGAARVAARRVGRPLTGSPDVGEAPELRRVDR